MWHKQQDHVQLIILLGNFPNAQDPELCRIIVEQVSLYRKKLVLEINDRNKTSLFYLMGAVDACVQISGYNEPLELARFALLSAQVDNIAALHQFLSILNRLDTSELSVELLRSILNCVIEKNLYVHLRDRDVLKESVQHIFASVLPDTLPETLNTQFHEVLTQNHETMAELLQNYIASFEDFGVAIDEENKATLIKLNLL